MQLCGGKVLQNLITIECGNVSHIKRNVVTRTNSKR